MVEQLKNIRIQQIRIPNTAWGGEGEGVGAEERTTTHLKFDSRYPPPLAPRGEGRENDGLHTANRERGRGGGLG